MNGADISSNNDETDRKDFNFRISLSSDNNNNNNSSTTVPDTLRDRYRQDGFVVVPSVLGVNDVAALNDRLERILRGDYDRNQAPDKIPKKLKSIYHPPKISFVSFEANETEGDASIQSKPESDNENKKHKNKQRGGVAVGPLGFSGNRQNVKVLQVINVHKADHLFRKLAVNPDLGKLVAELAGWKQGSRLAQDQLWGKPPGAPPLVFHRDSPYFMVRLLNISKIFVCCCLDTHLCLSSVLLNSISLAV